VDHKIWRRREAPIQSWPRAKDKPGSSASIGRKDALRMARR
jgi:hypothetical protein